MVLCEVAHNFGVADQVVNVASGNCQFQDVSAIGVLDQAVLALYIGEFTTHSGDFVIVKAF